MRGSVRGSVRDQPHAGRDRRERLGERRGGAADADDDARGGEALDGAERAGELGRERHQRRVAQRPPAQRLLERVATKAAPQMQLPLQTPLLRRSLVVVAAAAAAHGRDR